MKANNISTVLRIAALVVCFCFVNESFAQRYIRKPSKMLTFESLGEVTDNPIKVGAHTEKNVAGNPYCVYSGISFKLLSSKSVMGYDLYLKKRTAEMDKESREQYFLRRHKGSKSSNSY